MLRMNCLCTEGRLCGPAIVTLCDTLLHSSLCGCTAESLPPSAPRVPPILPTHSLCRCTAESLPPSAPRAPHGSILPACSRSSLVLLPVDAPPLVLSAVVLRRACSCSLTHFLRTPPCRCSPPRSLCGCTAESLLVLPRTFPSCSSWSMLPTSFSLRLS